MRWGRGWWGGDFSQPIRIIIKKKPASLVVPAFPHLGIRTSSYIQIPHQDHVTVGISLEVTWSISRPMTAAPGSSYFWFIIFLACRVFFSILILQYQCRVLQCRLCLWLWFFHDGELPVFTETSSCDQLRSHRQHAFFFLSPFRFRKTLKAFSGSKVFSDAAFFSWCDWKLHRRSKNAP